MNNFEEIFKNISSRRSIRNYNDKEISHEIFLKLIEAATWAPNGCRAEAWFFYVVTDQEKIKEMREAIIAVNPKSDFYKQYQIFHNARYVICACVNMDRRWYHRDIDYTKPGVEAIDNPDYFSLAAAVENLLLAAQAMNIGACWIGVSEAFRPSLEKVIGIEAPHMLAINIAVGHYDEIPPTPRRRPAKDVTKFI